MPLTIRAVALLLAASALAGCASYAPPVLDTKTGAYSTSVQVDRGGVLAFETDVDPKTFGTVLLVADSNVYPERFEFFARQVLAELGVRRVQNLAEMSALQEDQGFAKKVDGESVAAFSGRVQRVLVIDLKSKWDGDVRRYVTLRVSDGQTGRVLLDIDHRKVIWMEVDSEAHYPVFNELRRWYAASAAVKG